MNDLALKTNVPKAPAAARAQRTQAGSAFDLSAWMAQRLGGVESAMARWVACPETRPAPAGLGDAMRYAVLDGGKRLRAACAVELIHAYSLVHDDMPCMDNDVLRRGKPTVHVQFGEAQALLAGDALQALAFELLTPDDASVSPGTQALMCRMLAQAAGFRGMAGGQAIDLASVGKPLTSAQLHEMHRLKTGALLQVSVLMGAACGKVGRAAQLALSDYGAAIGLAFQVVDDVLDVVADSSTLGKTAGKDAAQDKPTFVSLMGLRDSQNYAQELLSQALASLRADGLQNTAALRALADMLVNRGF